MEVQIQLSMDLVDLSINDIESFINFLQIDVVVQISLQIDRITYLDFCYPLLLLIRRWLTW